LHKLTSFLTKHFTHIGIEDLNVSGMMKNRKLARAIADAGFYEFKRQLAYKAGLYGSTVVMADRWFPSSKTCNECGCVKPHLELDERTWKCTECGAEHDRDVNAAKNLERIAQSSWVKACGADVSRDLRVLLSAVKQEPGSPYAV
jgi:putative transposase